MTLCSIIIPAHNEEAVIARSLETVLRDAPKGAIEVIVACNGCSDRTAEIARRFGNPVRVVETETASKAAGLNLGDEAASYFPRIYMDADVEMGWPDIIRLIQKLDEPGVKAAAPWPETKLQQSSFAVRAFYRVWMRTDYFKSGMIGCGVYALSQTGRTGFDEFPLIIADDGFIRSRFVWPERQLAPQSKVRVYPPRTLSALIGIKTRSRLGRYELAAIFPEQVRRERAEKTYSRTIKRLVTDPRNWFGACIYLYVNLVARVRAARQLNSMSCYQWERDDSSRLNGTCHTVIRSGE